MAYIGMNKAQQESQEFLNKESGKINAWGTVLQTSTQIGLHLMEQANNNAIQDLTEKASTEIDEGINRIYQDYEPEQWKEQIGRYIDIYGETYANDRSRAIQKGLQRNLNSIKSQKLKLAEADINKKNIERIQEHGIKNINAVLTTHSINEHNRKTKLIESKDYEYSEQEPTSLSESFLSLLPSGESQSLRKAKEDHNPNFNKEIHEMSYAKDMDEKEVRLKTIEHYARQIFPNDEEGVRMLMEESESKLEKLMPEHAQDMLLAVDFPEDDPSSWDYGKSYEAYAKSITELPEAQQTDLLNRYAKKWEAKNLRKQKVADDYYDKNIKDRMFNARVNSIIDSNSPFLTETVMEIYKEASEETGIPLRFFVDQMQSDLAIAAPSERIYNQNQAKAIWGRRKNPLEGDAEKWTELTKLLTADEILSVQQSTNELIKGQALIGIEEFMGVDYNVSPESYANLSARITGGDFKGNPSGFFDAIDQAKKDGMPQFGIDMLTVEYATQESRNQRIELSENKEIADYQKEYANLYIKTDKTEADKERLSLLESKMSLIELASAKAMGDSAGKTLMDMARQEALEIEYGYEKGLFSNIYTKLDEGGYENYSDLKTDLDSAKANGMRDEDISWLKNKYMSEKQDENFIQNEKTIEANKELELLLLRRDLSDASVKAVFDKHGLNDEKYAEFRNSWNRKAEVYAEDNASKKWLELDFDDAITEGQVNAIAEAYGIGKDNALYKQWINKAESNRKTLLEDIASKGRGFGDKTDEDVWNEINTEIGKLLEGKTTQEAVRKLMDDNIGNLKENDFLSAYDSMKKASTMHTDKENNIFFENVLRPFAEERDTIMPGASRERFEKLGLDAVMFEDQLRELEDQEVINQHNAYAPVVLDAGIKLNLYKKGFKDEDLTALGFDLPDMSMYETLEWMHMNPDTKKPTAQELIQKEYDDAKGKVIVKELPSGTSFSGDKLEDITKNGKEKADSIQKLVVDSFAHGADEDDTYTLGALEVSLIKNDTEQYQKDVFEAYSAGDITEKTYKEYMKKDPDSEKDPEIVKEREAKKKAIEDFNAYLIDNIKMTKDSNGKAIQFTNYFMDSVAKQGEALFLQRLEEAEKYSNGSPVNIKDVMDAAYRDATDEYYHQSAKKFVSWLSTDTSEMFKGVFNGKKTDSMKAFEVFSKGELLFTNIEVLEQFLNKPKTSTDSYGVNSGMIEKWSEMYKSGSSSKQVSQQILSDTVRNLNVNLEGMPEVGDMFFDSKFSKYVNKLPFIAKNQIYQTAAIGKWSVDITNMAIKELGTEMISGLDPDGVVNPIIENNRMGVKIGETRIYLEVGGNSKDTSYLFKKANGETGAVTIKAPTLQNAENKFTVATKHISSSFNDTKNNIVKQKPVGNARMKEYEAVVDEAALYKHLQGMVVQTYKSEKFSKATEEYINTMNQYVKEQNALLGVENPYYDGIKLYVDVDGYQKAIADNSILKAPLTSFIKHKLIPAQW